MDAIFRRPITALVYKNSDNFAVLKKKKETKKLLILNF